ncbi:MAG TPA: hypothetical protein VFN97_01000 [Actinospica sp.]|nr:hypothetical protein [Actinospica sp.]
MSDGALRRPAAPQRAFEPDPKAVDAARVLRVSGVGVLLAAGGGTVWAGPASDEAVYRLCALEADGEPGPAAASLGSGEIVRCLAAAGGDGRRPGYPELLAAAGYAVATAVPVGSGAHGPGVLLLCQRRAVRLSAQRERLAGVLAALLVDTAVRGQAMRRLQATIESLGATMRRIDQEVADRGDGADGEDRAGSSGTERVR